MSLDKKKLTAVLLGLLILVIIFGSLLFQYLQTGRNNENNQVAQNRSNQSEQVSKNNEGNFKNQIQRYVAKLQGRKQGLNSGSLVYNLLDKKGESIKLYRMYKDDPKNSNKLQIVENGFVKDGFDKAKRFTVSTNMLITYETTNSESDPLSSYINVYYPDNEYSQLAFQNKWDDSTVDHRLFPHKIIASYPDQVPDFREKEKATDGLYLFTRETGEEAGLYIWDITSKQKTKISDKICRWTTFNKSEILCLEGLKLWGLGGDEPKDYGEFQQCAESTNKLYCNRGSEELIEVSVENPKEQKTLYKAPDKESIGFVSYSHIGEVLLQKATGQSNQTGALNDKSDNQNLTLKTYEFKDGNTFERPEFKDLIVTF